MWELESANIFEDQLIRASGRVAVISTMGSTGWGEEVRSDQESIELTLVVRTTDMGVELAWPGSAGDALQVSDQLGPKAQWRAVPGSILDGSGEERIMRIGPNASAAFYRLGDQEE